MEQEVAWEKQKGRNGVSTRLSLPVCRRVLNSQSRGREATDTSLCQEKGAPVSFLSPWSRSLTQSVLLKDPKCAWEGCTVSRWRGGRALCACSETFPLNPRHICKQCTIDKESHSAHAQLVSSYNPPHTHTGDGSNSWATVKRCTC